MPPPVNRSIVRSSGASRCPDHLALYYMSLTNGLSPRYPATFAVVVPVKAFHRAKSRLAPLLSPSQRSELTKLMALRTMSLLEGVRSYIVCDDTEVATWAKSHGYDVIYSPRIGLNQSLRFAITELERTQIDTLTILPIDLVLLEDLGPVISSGEVIVAPDMEELGTNALALPLRAELLPHFGANSFTRHLQLGKDSNVSTRIVRSREFAFDLDTPDDLMQLRRTGFQLDGFPSW